MDGFDLLPDQYVPWLWLPNPHLHVTALSDSHRDLMQEAEGLTNNCCSPPHPGNIPGLGANLVLSSLLHLLASSELPLLLCWWLHRPGQALQQLTTQRRIKQSAKQTASINPQITNCLHISEWLMERESSHMSHAGCRAMAVQPSALQCPIQPRSP